MAACGGSGELQSEDRACDFGGYEFWESSFNHLSVNNRLVIWSHNLFFFKILVEQFVPVEPHEAVAEVSRIGNV